MSFLDFRRFKKLKEIFESFKKCPNKIIKNKQIETNFCEKYVQNAQKYSKNNCILKEKQRV